MRPYDGKSNPHVHQLKYEQHTKVAGASEEIMYKCFPIYLTDLATMWFYRLDPSSIDSYAQLFRSFKSQFRIHMVQPKDLITLTDVKQRDGETLVSYLTTFNAAAAVVTQPDDRLLHMAVVAGVNKRT